MAESNKPKPDDRSNNVERLQAMVENTKHNKKEAEISMEFAGPTEREKIKAKNQRRDASIQAMKEEIQDEAADRENGYQ